MWNQSGKPMEINKVLLVDDDPAVSKMAVVCLQKIGKWDVKVASNGYDALRMLKAYQPDVIVLDVMMPGMDGFEVLNHLKRLDLTKEIPVIFMTAMAQTRELSNCIGRGARGVIQKPFNPMLLPAQIKAILIESETNVRESA